jgi:hypothetical protein
MPGLTADSLVETIDGPTPIGQLAGRSMPVLTRFPDPGHGNLGFRIMKVAKEGKCTAVVKVTLDNGQSVTVAADHVFYRKGAQETVLAKDLKVGEQLEAAWVFPEGYVSPKTGKPSAGCYQVVAVEEMGEALVFHGPVNQTHWYFLTCGVLCKDGE